MAKPVTKWTRADFLALPRRDSGTLPFDSVVALPLRKLHDSGYRCVDFVGVRAGVPICRLAGCSDVLHLGGIGGYNLKKIGALMPAIDWTIDWLATSGLAQIFTYRHSLKVGSPVSSFEIFAYERKTQEASVVP